MEVRELPLVAGEGRALSVEVWPVESAVGMALARVVLSIDGRCLGRRDDPVEVTSLFHALASSLVVHDERAARGMIGRPAVEVWNVFDESRRRERWRRDGDAWRSDGGGQRAVSAMPPIEFFDDYEMITVADSRVVRFLWGSSADREHRSFDALVPQGDARVVVDELEAIIVARWPRFVSLGR